MRHQAFVGRSRVSGGPRSLLANAVLLILPLAPIRGRTWLAQKTREKVQPSGDLMVRLTDGSRLVLPAKSTQSWNPAAKGSYDLPIQRLVQWFAKPNSVVIDIGACFGLYAISLGRVGERDGWSVLAIEPVGANADVLQRNVELNSLQHVIQIERLAVGATSGIVQIDVEESGTGNAAIRSGSEAFHEDHCVSNTAQLVRLDDLTIDKAVSCMKIDVEGYEIDVLHGGIDLIKRNRPVIIGEFEPWQLELRGVSVQDLFAWCIESGYVLYSLDLVHEKPYLDVLHANIARVSTEMSWTGCLLIPEERVSELPNAKHFANSAGA